MSSPPDLTFGFPPLYMVRAPSFRVWFFVIFTAVAHLAAGQQPVPVPIEGVPSDFRYCLSVVRTGTSWVALSTDSLLWDLGTGGAPRLVRPPSGRDFRVAAAHPKGLVIAGLGQCYLYSRGEWTDLGVDDHFWSGLAVGSDVLLVGQQGVYRVDPEGRTHKLRELSGSRPAQVHLIGGRAVIFAVRSGILEWVNGELRPADARFPWAQGSEVASVQELPGGGLFAATSRGLFLTRDGVTEPVCQPVWAESHKNLLIGATLFDQTLVVATYYGGLRAYDLRSARELWRIPLERLGGNVYCSLPYADGLLIGSATGIHVLPDPNRQVFSALPPGEILFVARHEGEPVIGLTSGVFTFQGQPREFPITLYSLAQLEPGLYAQGGFGAVHIGDQRIPLGGRDVQRVLRLGDRHLAAMQPHAVTILTREAVHQRLNLPTTHNSIAATADGHLVVGTAAGALVTDIDGKVLRTLGRGLTRVYPIGDDAVLFDSAGQVLRPDGQVLAQLPSGETLDAIAWRGQLCVLARFEKGQAWAGVIDPAAKAWRPLDLPMPSAPLRLFDHNGELVVLGADRMVRDLAPRPLAQPSLQELRVAAGERILPGTSVHLGAREESVDLLLPAPRLPPWKNPVYWVQMDGEAREQAAPGSSQRIPRLPWGDTTLAVSAEWAGLDAGTQYRVHRNRPWWAATPALLVYAAGLGLLGYYSVRFRTRQLERRALRLQAMVDERTSELRKAQKAREDFFSTLSHEIRNPLNGVVGICEILEEAPGNAIAARERVFVRTLRGCADQLRSILDDVLDFARIDRGEIQVHEESFDLTSAVEGAARAADADLSRCRLHLPEGAVWVRGDVGKVRQIVTNLVSNAIKYGVPPGAEVKVSLTPQTGDTLLASISVINTGSTIPAEELERIFSGFVRGSDAVNRRIAGNGIGLAVSRRMAVALGGTLTATSEGGVTQFTLSLTLPRAEAPATRNSAVPIPLTSRALAIEDEQYNRLVLGHILARMGYEVDWAPDGATAMERIRSANYDLILTDFSLPDTNGIDLARAMLAEIPEPKPPVIAVTAYSTPEKMQQAKEAGISGFVTKPVSKQKLEAAIEGLGPIAPMRQASGPEPVVACDFSSLLRIQNGRQLLAQYAEELPLAWEELARAASGAETGERALHLSRAVHAFRSRVLAVHAIEVAEQLALLENAVRDAQHEDVRRLLAVVGPMIADIAAAARDRAVA